MLLRMSASARDRSQFIQHVRNDLAMEDPSHRQLHALASVLADRNKLVNLHQVCSYLPRARSRLVFERIIKDPFSTLQTMRFSYMGRRRSQVPVNFLGHLP